LKKIKRQEKMKRFYEKGILKLNEMKDEKNENG